MILDGNYFTFGSFNSEDYGLIFAHIETEEFLSLAGTITSTTLFNKKRKASYFTGYDYSSSPISFDAEIVSNCGEPISQDDCKVIEKALFNKSQRKKLRSKTGDVSTDSYYFNCVLINPSRILSESGTIGFQFTVECDSPYLWQDDTNNAIAINGVSGETKTFSVTVDSDMDEYIYPSVLIEMGDTGGDITIINQSDSSSRLTSFTNLSANAGFEMMGDINYVSDGYYQLLNNQNFIRLVDGINEFSVMGNVKNITLSWNNRRFIEL